MTVSIEEAQAKLSQLVDQLAPGEELVVQEHGKPKLVRIDENVGPRVPGVQKGQFVLTDNFNTERTEKPMKTASGNFAVGY